MRGKRHRGIRVETAAPKISTPKISVNIGIQHTIHPIPGPKQITIDWMGRLCNQMFQYATLYAVSKQIGACMTTPPWEGEQLFKLPPSTRPLPTIQRYREHSDQRFDPRIFQLRSQTKLVGYFQTEAYFAPFKKEILELFTFNNNTQQQASAYLAQFKKPIVVHSREGDFATSRGVFPVMRRQYYEKALELIRDKVTDPDIILISDNPTSHALDFLPDVHRPRLSSHVELALLSNADACILSPSSYSWWGAYLNRQSPVVVGPKYWINAFRPWQGWFPTNIEVPGWNYIEA